MKLSGKNNMFHFRSIFRMLVMIIIIAPAIIVEGYSISTNDNEFNPLNRDAKKYASEYEIDLESAIHRLTIQHLAGGLDAELSTQEYKTYAGLWIQHDPQFRIVVLFTQDGQETIQPYIDNEPLEYYVDLRISKVPLLELVSAQETVLNTVDELGIPAESGINVFENRVELYVTDSIRLETLIKDTGIQLPDYVEIIKVNGLSTDTADIYGGLTLSTCTSGFSVKHTGGETGIVTASHCANVQSYNGEDLTLMGSAEGESYDVQWHVAPGFTVRNLAYDGSGNRHIYSTKHRDLQAVNEWVCKYGMTTGYECGNIIDKSYRSTIPGHTWSATFIRVHHDGIDLSEPGDSGGPWFLGSTAYGIMKGQIGDDAIYMAINYIDILDLAVLTNRVYMPIIVHESQDGVMSISNSTNPYPSSIDDAPITLPPNSQPYPFP